MATNLLPPRDPGNSRPWSQVGAAAIGMCGALVTAGACVDSTGPAWPLIEETVFAPALEIDLSQMARIDGGIYVQDLVVGSGLPVYDQVEMVVDYEIFLTDGQIGESATDRILQYGCRAMMAGLESGMSWMNVGGTRKIIVPPYLGYGGSPPVLSPIPPGSILVGFVTVKSLRRRACYDPNAP